MRWVLIGVGTLAGVVAVVAIIGTLLPVRHVVSRSSRFNHPPEAVWSVITGPPDWRPDVSSFEILSPADGHKRWKEIDKRGHAITYEEVESIPPRRSVRRIADPNLPFGGAWTHEITPETRGCTLTITENGEVYNPIFRFISRFVIGHAATLDAYMSALRRKLGEA